MPATVIDQLVVTLGLDPSKFGTKAQEAQTRLAKFNATVKKLGVDEAKLTDQQKKQVDALRQVAVQGERTGKELANTGAIGKELWGVLEKGALGFGAALGLAELGAFTKNAVDSTAALGRLAPALGMSSREADTWSKAIYNAGGAADAGFQSLGALNAALTGLRLGQPPTALVNALGQLSRLGNGGKPINYLNPDRTIKSASQLMLEMADPIKNAGQQVSHTLLDSVLGADTVTFLGRGRAGVEAALGSARQDTKDPQQVADALKLQEATRKLTTAFDNLEGTVVLLAAPAVTKGLSNASALLKYATGKIDLDTFLNQVRQNDIDAEGVEWVHKRDAERIVSDPVGGSWLGGLFSSLNSQDGPNYPTWTHEQRVKRATELLNSGMAEEDVMPRIFEEEKRGPPPVSPDDAAVRRARSHDMLFGGGSTPSDALLDAIRDAGERSGSNSVSPKGARGRYQFMPGTAAQYGLTDPTDDAASRAAAKRYLTDLYAHFGDWGLAVAAYNTGQGNLDADIAEAKKAYGTGWRAHLSEFLPDETAAYMPRVMGAAGAAGGVTTINQNGPVNIAVASGDPRQIARGWHQAVTEQANSGAR